MIEEKKYSSVVIKKHFNKELMMTKEDNGYFKNSTKCWIFDNGYIENEVRDHCHITGECKSSEHRDFNIKLKLNQTFLTT